MRGYWKPFQSL